MSIQKNIGIHGKPKHLAGGRVVVRQAIEGANYRAYETKTVKGARGRRNGRTLLRVSGYEGTVWPRLPMFILDPVLNFTSHGDRSRALTIKETADGNFTLVLKFKDFGENFITPVLSVTADQMKDLHYVTSTLLPELAAFEETILKGEVTAELVAQINSAR